MLNPTKKLRRKLNIDAYKYASASTDQIKDIHEKENKLYKKGLIVSGVLLAALLLLKYGSK